MAKFPCSCGDEFDSEEDLLRHAVEAHGAQRQPVGSCCGMNFYTEEALKKHQQTTHGR
ncbi:MAG: hypothetical protein HY660_07025 [Armatimonadetes bacterium]|nr:hypothetical protein [Armatimonadota bacterium]